MDDGDLRWGVKEREEGREREGQNVMGPDIFARFKGPRGEMRGEKETLYKCPRSTFEMRMH